MEDDLGTLLATRLPDHPAGGVPGVVAVVLDHDRQAVTLWWSEYQLTGPEVEVSMETEVGLGVLAKGVCCQKYVSLHLINRTGQRLAMDSVTHG